MTIFIFGIMHGLLPLDNFRYMVTCKSSKSRTYLDFGGMGQKGHQLWIYMPLKTLFQKCDPLTKSCLIFWLFVLCPSTPSARPWLHHFKLLFRLSCNFMRFFVKTMENWWSKHLFLKSLLLSLNLCESLIPVRFYIEPHNPIPPHGVQYCSSIVMYNTTAIQKCKNILHRIACF